MLTPPEGLVIYPDGSAFVEPDVRIQLPRPAVDQLRHLLARLPFDELKSYYGPAAVTDQPSYTIEYAGRTVRTESGTPPAPPRLWSLVAQLSGIVEQAREPFAVRIVVTTAPQLALTLSREGVSKECASSVARVLRRIDTSAFSPGLVPRTLRNPPKTLEITRDFSSFHVRLDGHPPKGARELAAAALRAARAGCG
jgi:hypothetical protein